ncbi:hypothetical protein RJ640_025688 [Escallonia rubra]|uniref:Ribosomal protein L34Ae n=1 Tax=Escallonia rubra TaxID=112253 RepID=A0AA88URF1_9ASTE|nr:hypothetical protein RJ640_025688 [Escallonia rubra]
MGSVDEFMLKKLGLCFGQFWFYLSTYLLPLFGFLSKILFRLRKNENNSSGYSKFIPEQDVKEDLDLVEFETQREEKGDEIRFTRAENDEAGNKDGPEYGFTFKFPAYEELRSSRGGSDEFLSLDAFGDKDAIRDGFLSDKDFRQVHYEEETVHEEMPINSSNAVSMEEGTEEICTMEFSDDKVQVNEEGVAISPVNEAPTIITESIEDHMNETPIVTESIEDHMNEAPTVTKSIEDRVQFENVKAPITIESRDVGIQSNSNSSYTDSDSDWTSSDLFSSVTSRWVDSHSDGYLSDGDFGGEFELDVEDHESEDLDEEDSDALEELKTLEDQLGNSDKDFLREEDFDEDLDKSKHMNKHGNGAVSSEKPESKNASVLDSEDVNKLETLWEHQELIEQLKMELKKVRATGLPTILEESESPKMMEDLKPWKIDEKFQHENPMGELHKFYKSYRERMRKFDILNYQKMYAIGFLQLKDPLQSFSTQKFSVPEISSLLSQKDSPLRRKKNENEPMMKFVNELQGDLEIVYVGHMCLSWEFLQWQYEKALDLWESDPRRIRRFNEVAGEFQQFQVLVQRFVEDESFQGPRVQNYVKNRCILRNLLQVPVIREDSSKERKKARRSERGDYAITTDMLVEIIEASIRIFWRFVKADKDCTSVIVKGRKRPVAALQDPADSELLMQVQKSLQKKERKLKDLLRSENCILRRFQRCREDTSDQVFYFFSQVDLKLVSRVLNMSRISTDQLVWCSSKLSKISFVNRKIHVESSFSLFPC